MAYIRKRGKTWTYVVEGNRDSNGERGQITKGGFRTKRDAELAASQVEVEVATGTFVKETNVTFEGYAEIWLNLYRSQKKKKSSIRQREYQIKALNRYFGKLKIASITRKKYRETILKMNGEIARNTLLGIHGVAKLIFRLALEDGDIKSDPTEFVRVPSASDDEQQLPKYMEKEQLAQFLKLARLHGLPGDYEMFTLLAYTGMRLGEACVLKWTDVDFAERTITINGTLYNPADISTFYEILAPKTKNSRRTIDVDQVVIGILENLRAKQNEFRMLHRKNYHEADFIFGRMDTPAHPASRDHFGYPPIRRTVELRMKRIMQMMNHPAQLTPHSLRHTHTSLCAEAGISLEVIMERLGHKNDQVTRTVYLHITKTLKKEAASKFSAFMSDVVKL